MTQSGYQEGSDAVWWWGVARHLDEAQLALFNAMAHNLDDQGAAFVLEGKLRESQGILLAIFQAKGLVPSSMRGKFEVSAAVDRVTVAVEEVAVQEIEAPLPGVELPESEV